MFGCASADTWNLTREYLSVKNLFRTDVSEKYKTNFSRLTQYLHVLSFYNELNALCVYAIVPNLLSSIKETYQHTRRTIIVTESTLIKSLMFCSS